MQEFPDIAFANINSKYDCVQMEYYTSGNY